MLISGLPGFIVIALFHLPWLQVLISISNLGIRLLLPPANLTAPYKPASLAAPDIPNNLTAPGSPNNLTASNLLANLAAS